MVPAIAGGKSAWHDCIMIDHVPINAIPPSHHHMAQVRRAQIENLYLETLILADDAQAVSADVRDILPHESDGELAIAACTEAMMTAARLTHILAWLLHQRAILDGEVTPHDQDVATHLAGLEPADWTICHQLDEPARRAVAASERLYERIILLEDLWAEPVKLAPVQSMIAELRARL